MPKPLAYFMDFTDEMHVKRWNGTEFAFQLFRFPQLQLGHTAALLVLQGQKLSDLLVPNHFIVEPGEAAGEPWGHLIVHHARWAPWGSPPTLYDVTLANILPVPDAVPDAEVLSAIVAAV